MIQNMDIMLLIQSIAIGFGILGTLFLVSLIINLIQSSAKWFLVVIGIVMGIMIYLLQVI